MRSIDDIYRDRVRERDLDNFLVEEIYASPSFLIWILERLEQRFLAPNSLEVRLQKSPPRETDRRQTDVRVGWFDDASTMHACILLESKVTADFQLGQAEAYASEVAELRLRLGPSGAAAVLIAPLNKLPSLKHDGCFDAAIAIEDIVGFLRGRSLDENDAEIERRLEMRIQLLEALCGKRATSSWIGGTVSEKRDFAGAYAALAAEILPELRVRPSTDGPKAITRIFEGLEIGGLPVLTLRHEFGASPGWKYANVQFKGKGAYLTSLTSSGLLAGTPYTAEKAGKSLAVRVSTPAVDPMQAFSEQRHAVERGLLAIRELVSWLRDAAPQLAVLMNEHVR